ncbi:MAG: hypothetical protein OJJ21_19725 [Ferrovibrio sp.]|uniref:hypothetical protein n=1 Tax=Ferrovibrio sp. TaxID=1917215 RepID=UPI00263094F6|nr:hypothetical protein [Ferrovibrio sp.]MCW0235837.1 hypothetical protein [Ferrovibrio sp.]
MNSELQAFFDSYRAAFDRLDAAAIAAHFAVPGMLIDGAPRVWTRPEDILANMVALVALYRDGGYAGASCSLAELLLQGADNAVANLVWTVARREGLAPWRFRTGYTLHRFADGWKIVLCTAYEERVARTSEA